MRYFTLFLSLTKSISQEVDRQMVRIDNEVVDDIAAYQNMRCIGSQKASRRILSIPQSERFPSAQTLPVHLLREQLIFFADNRVKEAVQNKNKQKN